jgi:uncharacterized alkaline shock family protein YloU
MGEQSLISPDVLARYAGDAAREVAGVAALAESSRHRGHPVAVAESEDALDVTVHVELEWGRSAQEVGGDVQRRVREYLERMTDRKVRSVDVVVEGVSAAPAKR